MKVFNLNNSKASALVILLCLASIGNLFSQTDGVSIDYSGSPTREAKAILQLNSTEQGFILPRMTSAERLAIAPPASAQGMTVYQTNLTEGYYYWDGTQWLLLSASTGGGYIEYLAVDNAFGTGQAASYDITGNAEIGGSLEVSGNVGINTNSPTAELHIVKADAKLIVEDGVANNSYIALNAGNAGSPQIELTDKFGDMSWAMGGDDALNSFKIAGVASGAMPTINNNNSAEVKLTIETDGNVGIGVIDPTEKLDIDGKIRMRSGATNGYIPVSNVDGVMTWTDPTTITASDNDWLKVGGGTPAVTDEVYHTGNVGIGTTNPETLLDVEGSVSFPFLVQRTGDVDEVGIEFQDDATTGQKGYLSFDHRDASSVNSVSSFHFNTTEATMSVVLDVDGGFYAGSDVALRTNGDSYLNGGNVGIGVTAPDQKLVVDGIIRATDEYRPSTDDWAIRRVGENLQIIEVEQADKIWAEFVDDTRLHLSGIPDLWLDGNLRVSGGTPVVGEVLMATNTNGDADWVDISAAGIGDNLGNHSATTTLDMNNNNITDVNVLSGRSVGTYDKLRVWNNSSYTIGMITGNTLGYLNNDYAMTFTMNADNDRGFLWRDISDDTSDGAMSLTTDGRLYVKSTAHFNGDVGIGTNAPDQLLHVSSGTSGDAIIHLTADTDNSNENDNPQIVLEQDGAAVQGFLALEGDAGTVSAGTMINTFIIGSETSGVQLVTSDNVRMTIESGGDIGIRTTAPTTTLDVNGTVRIRGGSPAVGDVLTATSTNGTATWSAGVPKGTIVAWHKNGGGGTLPSGWQECDGSPATVNGVTIPNLNGGTTSKSGDASRGRFLRGHTSSGLFEGDVSNNFYQVNQDNDDGGSNTVTIDDDGNYTGWFQQYYSNDRMRFRNEGVETRVVNMSVVWIIKTD
jgi:hypothetical protein